MRTVLVWCCGAEGTTRAALIVIGFYAAQLIVLGGLALAATSSLTWRQGDAIPLGRDRTLRVIGIVASREDEPSVLIVEDLASTSWGHWFEPSTAHFDLAAPCGFRIGLRVRCAVEAGKARKVHTPVHTSKR
jgi:hypothetical protein